MFFFPFFFLLFFSSVEFGVVCFVLLRVPKGTLVHFLVNKSKNGSSNTRTGCTNVSKMGMWFGWEEGGPQYSFVHLFLAFIFFLQT